MRGRVHAQPVGSPQHPPRQPHLQQQQQQAAQVVAASTLTTPTPGLLPGGAGSVNLPMAGSVMTSQPIFVADSHSSAVLHQQPRRVGPRHGAESTPPLSRLDPLSTSKNAAGMARVARSQSPPALGLHSFNAPSNAVRDSPPGRGIDPGRTVERSVLEPLGRCADRGPEASAPHLTRAFDMSRSPPPPGLRSPAGTPCGSGPRLAPGRPLQLPAKSASASGSLEVPQRTGAAPPTTVRVRAPPAGALTEAALGGDPPLSEGRIKEMVRSVLEEERKSWSRDLQNVLLELRQVSERCAAAEVGASNRADGLEERIASLESTYGNEPTCTHRSFVKVDSPRRHRLDECRADIDRLQEELLSLVQGQGLPASTAGDRMDLREAITVNRDSIQAVQMKQREIVDSIGAREGQLEDFAARIACAVKEAVCVDGRARAKFEEAFDSGYTVFSERMNALEGVANDAFASELSPASKLGDPSGTAWRGCRDGAGREPEEAGSEFQESHPVAKSVLLAVQRGSRAPPGSPVDLRNAGATVAAPEERCRAAKGGLVKPLDLTRLRSQALIDASGDADVQQQLRHGQDAGQDEFAREKREVLTAIAAIRAELRECHANGFVSAVTAAAAAAWSSGVPEPVILREMEVHAPRQEMEPLVEASDEDEDGPSDDEGPGRRQPRAPAPGSGCACGHHPPK